MLDEHINNAVKSFRKTFFHFVACWADFKT